MIPIIKEEKIEVITVDEILQVLTKDAELTWQLNIVERDLLKHHKIQESGVITNWFNLRNKIETILNKCNDRCNKNYNGLSKTELEVLN
jgi:hypothetical protein